MKLLRLFPAIKPRHSFESVVRELIDGLRNGSIVLDKPLPRPRATEYSTNGSCRTESDHSDGPLLQTDERAK